MQNKNAMLVLIPAHDFSCKNIFVYHFACIMPHSADCRAVRALSECANDMSNYPSSDANDVLMTIRGAQTKALDLMNGIAYCRPGSHSRWQCIACGCPCKMVHKDIQCSMKFCSIETAVTESAVHKLHYMNALHRSMQCIICTMSCS